MALILRSSVLRRFLSTTCRSSTGARMDLVYEDRTDYPAPHVRFTKDAELAEDLKALRKKEAGDWKNLTADEKRALYRLAFHKSYADMKAPTGEWKVILGGVCFALAVSAGIYMFQKDYILPEPPHTLNEDWQAQLRDYMIRMHNNPIEGIASKWDYEKNDWKK
ncbi:cytochrome c oxidase subunit 4 isoform 1, mitochondrial-like [Saccoglossus kowalevskii]|uniref:Cytochrome c oxidase subunit 4 n=1 Tax=Saccoglossus kowalevskii TaxID=10224 RepID=A0ABM0N1D6_SACKO|nr:PREDICTED: cytochrome c oxidase subunit 4 isoform 1, mitochondrial-like [Saccoglossus kowalevskii]